MQAEFANLDDSLIESLLDKTALRNASCPAAYFRTLTQSCMANYIRTADEYSLDQGLLDSGADDLREEERKARMSRYCEGSVAR